MTFGDFSRGMTKVLGTALVIGAGIVINPYKTGVLKIDTPDGGFKGYAKSSYGIDNVFMAAMTFSCEPVKGGARFVVEEHGPYTSTQDNKTEFYPESCQAGFDALFGQPSSLTRLYEMPDHEKINFQRHKSPPSRVIAAAQCVVNGIKVSGEDYVDGTGNLEAHWQVNTGKYPDISGAQVNGFPFSLLPIQSYAAQAQSLCNTKITKNQLGVPRNIFTKFYGYDDPRSVFVSNGDEGTLSVRGTMPFFAEVHGKRTPHTIGKALKKLDETSNGAVRVGDMSSLFTTMTGVKLELK